MPLGLNWITAGIFAFFMLSAFAGGWHVKGKFDDADQLASFTAAVAEKDAKLTAANIVSAALETQLSQQRQLAETLRKELRHALQDPAYDCTLPADGLSILNRAITGN